MKTKHKTTSKPVRKPACKPAKPAKPAPPTPPDDLTDIDRVMNQQARARGFRSFHDMLTHATESSLRATKSFYAPEPRSPYDTPVRRLAPHEMILSGDVVSTMFGLEPIHSNLIGKPEQHSARPCFRPVTVPRWVPFAERMPTDKDFVRFGTDGKREILVLGPGGVYSRFFTGTEASYAPGMASHWLEGLQPPTPPTPQAPSATVDAIIAALDARGDELLANPFGQDDPPRLREQAPLVGAAFKKAAELARKVAAGK